MLNPGEIYTRLTVIAKGKTVGRFSYYKCLCSCGAIKEVLEGNLKRRITKSCGCLQREITIARNRKHNMTGTKTYRCWVNMRARCKYPSTTGFADYGGRGIKVCERWEKFENFFQDMGEAPPEMDLDRKDTNGNYEPGNCRWATRVQNVRHRRNTVSVVFNGSPVLLIELSECFKINYYTLYKRIFVRGWTPEKAVSPANLTPLLTNPQEK